ncbi:MAG: hypothetical protein ACREA0_06390 [bacterium]
MNDHVVDTNVLLVASAAHPHSPFDDTHVPIAEQRAVFEWLSAFRGDSCRQLVLDELFEIYKEYRNRLTDQDFGLQVVAEKLNSVRQVWLDRDADGAVVVPDPSRHFDPSDHKLLAAALTDAPTISIVNACDSDWPQIEAELLAAGIHVEHIVEVWLRAYHAGRQ